MEGDVQRTEDALVGASSEPHGGTLDESRGGLATVTVPAGDVEGESDAQTAARTETLADAGETAALSGRDRLLQHDLPLLLVVLASLWFMVTFGTLVVRRHNEFGSFDYDLGIYDQGIWLLGEGRQFLTVRGLRFLGHHWNPATFVYVPFYWLGAGPNLLNASQAVALGVGAIPAYFGMKKISGSAWLGVVVALAYLAHPSTGWLANELFHPETMAIPFVLAAWAFAEHEKWRWYFAAVVVSLLWKEDIALAVAFLGLVVLWRKNRKYALLTFFGSLLYFVVATKLIIPQILGRSAFYEELFGPLGSSTTDLAKNAVLHPDLYFRVLREHQAETYLHSIVRPYGYVSLLSPSSLLIGLPQYLANLLNTLNFIWNPRYHYIAMPLVSATIAAARAISSRSKVMFRWGAALLVILFAFGVRNQGVAPWSNKYDDGYWPLEGQALTPVYQRAIAMVPDDPDIATSSPYFFTPHLTHRFEAYTFPNPWRVSYWAVKGENARSGDRVDYVVMNETVLGPEDRATYDTAVVKSGEFAEVFRENSVVVWKRIAPAKKQGSGVSTPQPVVPSTVVPPTVAPNVPPTVAPNVVPTGEAPTVAPTPTLAPIEAAVTVPAQGSPGPVDDEIAIGTGLPIVSDP